MIFCIESFSSALCLVHGAHQSLNDIPLECLVLTDNSKDVESVILKLSVIFMDQLQSIMDDMFPVEAFKCSAIFFVKTVLLRLIKVSVNPSYFHFMLLCSLVHTTISWTFISVKCFTLAKLTSLCLMMVYNRCYTDLFKENEEYESLGSYCSRINPILAIKNKSFLPDIDQQEIRSLLASLTDVDTTNFFLTDCEEKLVQDTLDVVPPETVSADSEISPSMSCQYSPSSVSPTDEDWNSSSSEEYSSPKDRICILCGRRCLKFLILYETEVYEKIRLSMLIRN